jgi:hypothetical protein
MYWLMLMTCDDDGKQASLQGNNHGNRGRPGLEARLIGV